jgi:hypothetical protein
MHFCNQNEILMAYRYGMYVVVHTPCRYVWTTSSCLILFCTYLTGSQGQSSASSTSLKINQSLVHFVALAVATKLVRRHWW